MGESLPKLTRALASDMAELKQIDKVKEHNGSTGEIDFDVDEEHALSSNRLTRMLPDGWRSVIVITSGQHSTAYVEQED